MKSYSQSSLRLSHKHDIRRCVSYQKAKRETGGLYYKHNTIVNYESSIVNKFGASLTDDVRLIPYDCLMFIA
jgi:hypothetical protein